MSNEDAALSTSVLRHAVQQVLHYLELSDGWRRIGLDEGQFHVGDDPMEADKAAHALFTQALRRHPAYPDLQIRHVVGEEARVNAPRRLKPGSRVVVVDPLDGSRQWAMFRSGYCVAALVLVADDSGTLTVESAVIGGPTNTFTMIGEHQVFFGPTYGSDRHDIMVTSAVPENEFLPPSVAIQGYKPSDRAWVLELMRRLDGWSVVTIAGNPITPYVAVGGLTAAVALRSQATWDAIGTLMCTALDVVVGGHDGTIVAGPAFRSLFTNVVLTGGNTAPIPPMIVAKNPDRFAELVAAIDQI